MNHPYSELFHQLCWLHYTFHLSEYEMAKEGFAAERKDAVLSNNPGITNMKDIPDRKAVVYPYLRANDKTFSIGIDWRVSVFSYRVKGSGAYRLITHRIKPNKKRNGDLYYPMSKFNRYKLKDYELEVIARYEEEFNRIRIAAKTPYQMYRGLLASRPLDDDRMGHYVERFSSVWRERLAAFLEVSPEGPSGHPDAA